MYAYRDEYTSIYPYTGDQYKCIYANIGEYACMHAYTDEYACTHAGAGAFASYMYIYR
jgi:hypothetical protein